MSDVTTAELRAMLRRRHHGNQWALYEEVRDSTGYSHTRTCDAVAMNLWPSKGLELHGFELKTSRSDYLNEIRDPDKADTFKQYCDRWWLVAGSRSILKNDLPDGWGLLLPRVDKLVVSVGASKLNPKPLPREMLAALLRCADKASLTKQERKSIEDAAYRRGLENRQKRHQQGQSFATAGLQRLKSSIVDFEERSGLSINEYNGERLGEAVKLVRSLRGDTRLLNRFTRLYTIATDVQRELEVQLKAVHAVMETKEEGADEP